jgi:hypothetical protein
VSNAFARVFLHYLVVHALSFAEDEILERLGKEPLRLAAFDVWLSGREKLTGPNFWI